jgi:hypothetical protein
MGYYIDLEKTTLDDYYKKLASAYLPPSRMILKEKLDDRFAYFGSIGIKNVKELMQLLKKKDKLKELSMVDGLSEEYLTVLLREIKSTLPKPNKLVDFNVVSKDAIEKLEKAGIKNTEKLFEKVIIASDRQNLAESVGISYSDILTLTKLVDLSRIKWVGVTYAQMLFQLGVDTVEKVSKSNPKELHTRLNQLIKEQEVFKGAIGLNDVNILIETAGELPFDIEY